MRPTVPPPADAEDLRRKRPIICYPVDNLPQPGLAALGAARQNLTRVAELLVPPRDGRAFEVPRGHFFRIVSIDGPQVGDLNLFNATNPSPNISSAGRHAHCMRPT
jgi:uncharacterized protein YcgI (DUF1989 family)